MAAPESVKKLIETFGNNLNFYKSAKYNEAQLRRRNNNALPNEVRNP